MPSQFGGVPVDTAPPSGASQFGGIPVDAAPPSNPSLNASISAPPETGIGGHVARWAQNVMDDIKYGTDITGVGGVLKKLGAHGVNVGAPEAVGNYMASLPLGLLRMAKGAGESFTPQGAGLPAAKDIGLGALQASEIPSAFVAPEGAAGAMEGAAKAVGKIPEMIPSVEHAGQSFSQVMKAAGDMPVNPYTVEDTAQRIKQLSQRGASMPKVVRDYLKRVSDPDADPLTYAEARDFYSNASRIAVDEAKRLTPTMKAQMAQFTADLGKSIEETAANAGQLQEYKSAMGEYSSAMRNKAIAQFLWRNALRTGMGAAGATGGYALYRDLTK